MRKIVSAKSRLFISVYYDMNYYGLKHYGIGVPDQTSPIKLANAFRPAID